MHSYRLQQPPRRPPRRHPEREAEAHHQVDRPPPRDRRALHRGPARARSFTLPHRAGRLPPRLPPLRHRDARSATAGEVPARRTASTPSSTTRSPSTSRKATPGARTPTSSRCRTAEQNAAKCLSLPMFPELTDDEVDYTIDQVPGVGQGRSDEHAVQGRRRRAWASAACTTPRRSRRTPASSWPASPHGTGAAGRRRPRSLGPRADGHRRRRARPRGASRTSSASARRRTSGCR